MKPTAAEPDQEKPTGSIPRVDVVIVTYNSERHIADAVSSLMGQRGVDLQVFVCDNGSDDGTVDILGDLAADHPNLEYVVDETNPGFASSVNRFLPDLEGDVVVIMNPDTRAAPHSSPWMLRDLSDHAADPSVGFATPLLLQAGGDVDAACARREPTMLRSAATLLARKWRLFRWVGRFGYNIPVREGGGLIQVDAINGAFMLIERKKLPRVGPMDERYWMYGEDLDWCRVARDADLSQVVWLDAVWVHDKGGSENGERSDRTSAAFKQAMSLYFDKYHPQPVYWPVRLLVRTVSKRAA